MRAVTRFPGSRMAYDRIGERKLNVVVGSMAADPYPASLCLLQYIQDKQEVILNDRFGVHIGPSGDFSDVQAGMSEIRTKSDHPQIPLDVLNAAEQDIHALRPVLTLSVESRCGAVV